MSEEVMRTLEGCFGYFLEASRGCRAQRGIGTVWEMKAEEKTEHGEKVERTTLPHAHNLRTCFPSGQPINGLPRVLWADCTVI